MIANDTDYCDNKCQTWVRRPYSQFLASRSSEDSRGFLSGLLLKLGFQSCFWCVCPHPLYLNIWTEWVFLCIQKKQHRNNNHMIDIYPISSYRSFASDLYGCSQNYKIINKLNYYKYFFKINNIIIIISFIILIIIIKILKYVILQYSKIKICEKNIHIV